MKAIAVKAAKEAGKLLLAHFGKPTIITAKVTKEDRDSEKKIIEIIESAYPDHSFLGEELGEKNPGSSYKWIIDPIDGTNNYIAGRESFSVSIGLEHEGEIILGVVYVPKKNELFIAEKGKGATLNGESIKVGTQTELDKAVFTLSTMPGLEKETEKYTKQILQCIPHVKYFTDKSVDPFFGGGSMALEFCYLACGRLDGLIRLKQKPWDVAAGSLIAAEAGAKMLNLKGEKCSIYEGDYIATNPVLLPMAFELLKFS